MNIKRLPITLILLAFLTAQGCGKADTVLVRVTGDREVSVRQGTRIKLELDANPTTGYTWRVKVSEEKGVLEMEGEGEYASLSDRVGSGGIQTYTFKTLRRGRENIVLEYVRPWEQGKEPARKYTVPVTVS